MAFTRPSSGGKVQSDHINQIIKAWEGDSGGANRMQLIQLSDSSNYVLDVRNLDTTNGYGLRVRDASNNVLLTAEKAGVKLTNSASGVPLYFGADVTLYRSAADTLKTDDSLIVAADLTVSGVVIATQAAPLQLANSHADLANDADIYRDSGATGALRINNTGTGGIALQIGGTTKLIVAGSGSVIVGAGALADAATDGFLYFPQTTSGAPSGAPTAATGRCAVVYDNTNDKLYIYDGAWKSVQLA